MIILKALKIGAGKRFFRLFSYIYIQHSPNVNIENVDEIISIMNNLDLSIYEKKDVNFINKAIIDFNENKDIIHNNMDIIDLNMVETPYLFNIICLMNELFSDKKTFNKNEVLAMLKLDRFDGIGSEETDKIMKKKQ